MNKTTVASLAVLLVSASAIIGCDSGPKVVKEETSVTPRIFGGETITKEKTIQNSDGSMSTEKSKVKTPG